MTIGTNTEKKVFKIKGETVDNFIDNMLHGEVIDYDNPKCIDCRECCTMGAYITDKEYKKILKYLNTDVNGKVLYKRAITTLKNHLEDGNLYWICPLSTENKKCGIYNVKPNIRPKVCRDFHCKKELNKIPDNEPKYKKGKMLAHLFIEDPIKLLAQVVGISSFKGEIK